MSLLCFDAATEIKSYTVLAVLALFTVATMFLSVFYFVKFKNAQSGGAFNYFIAFLIAGFALRVIAGLLVIGHRRDLYEVLYPAIEEEPYAVYPVAYYLLKLFTFPFTLAGTSTDSVIFNLFLKMPFILADLASAVLLYLLSKKYFNDKIGVVAAALVCLCPVFIFISAMWGSVLCLLAPVLLAAIYFMLGKKHVPALCFFALAPLVAKEALFILPVVLVYYIYVWIKGIAAYKKGEGGNDADLWLIPALLAGTVVAQYAVSIPYFAAIGNFSFANWFYKLFVSPFADVEYYAVNTLGIYGLIGSNVSAFDNAFPAVIMAIGFALVVALFTFFAYRYRANRAVIVLLIPYSIMLISTFLLGNSLLSILPTLVTLLAAFLILKDVRILRTFMVTGILILVTACIIFALANYYNTTEMLYFRGYSAEEYTGVTWLFKEYQPIIQVLSALQIINFVYMTSYVIDIAFAGETVPLLGTSEPTFGTTVKVLFTNEKHEKGAKDAGKD